MLRLKNRFFPKTHENSDQHKKLKRKHYNKNYREPICEDDEIPILAISGYSLLFGWSKNQTFGGWINKRSIRQLSFDAKRPETILVALILKAINLFPDPEAIFARLLARLIDINTKKVQSNLVKTNNRKE